MRDPGYNSAYGKDVLKNQYRSDVPSFTKQWFKDNSHIDPKEIAAKVNAVFPWDPNYDTLRMGYNKLVQFFPCMIVRVLDEKDIIWTLKFCRENKIPFSVRAGAHSTLGFSFCNGVIIDLSKFDQILSLSDLGVVKVRSGARIGEVALELGKHGYALAAGTCQNTGIAGLTLGGGLGFLTRKYGMTCDNVLEMEAILADGTQVILKPGHELFWALLGAGNGNFAVVTSFTYRVHRVKQVVLFNLWFDKENSVAALKLWQNWNPAKCLTSEMKIRKTENGLLLLMGQVDVNHWQKNLTSTHDTPEAYTTSLLQDFLPLTSSHKIWSLSYLDACRFFATPKPDWFFVYKTSFVQDAFPEYILRTIVEYIDSAPKGVYVSLHQLGGAVSELAEDTNAFAWRKCPFWLYIRSSWKDPCDQILLTESNHALFDQLLPWTGTTSGKTGSYPVPRCYPNFQQHGLGTNYGTCYWGDHYPRLQRIKAKYDPDMFFKTPQPIMPA